MTKKLVLIDSHALIHRAFHALPPLSSPTGQPTNAIYGFLSVLLKMITDVKPDYIAAAFDLAGPTFRHEEYDQYKAHRERGPDELYAQIPVVKEMLGVFGIPVYEQAGYEADDVIGSIAERTKDMPDLQTVIMTGDLDTLQLVQGESVVVFTLRKGVTDTVTYDEKAVHERFGLEPNQVTDFKGLKGDPSDNIPGVPGIGEKTASALIQAFGNIEDLYAAIDRGETKKPLTEKLIAKLVENKDMAMFSKKLATIVRTVDVKFDLERTDWRNHLDIPAIEAKCQELGFYSLMKRVNGVLAAGQQTELLSEPTPQMYTAPELIDGMLVGHDLKPHLKQLMDEQKSIPDGLFDTRIALWLLNPDSRQYEYPGGSLADTQKDLAGKLAGIGVQEVFEKIEMPLIPVLARMERLGIRVDSPKISELLESVSRQVATLEKDIYKLAGTEFNINSPAQLGEVLFTRLAITGKVRKTSGGALSTAAPELEKLRDAHPIINKVLEYREISKLKNTYIEPFPSLIGPDGRIHTTYNQTGAATGRLSSSDPNLQNIPTRTELGQQFRGAFIADPGRVLLSLDYSQIELRIVAHIAKDQTMIEAFRAGEDIHTRTASEIFGVAPVQVTKDMRRQAKVLNFGIIYGMGVLGFARAAGVPRQMAQKFIDEYFTRFSGVARYMEATKEQAFRDGWVGTLFGRRRVLPDITSRIPQLAAQAERMAINHPIQGTGADLVKMAMVSADAHIRKNYADGSVRMLLQVHDELVFEVTKEKAEAVGRELKSLMEAVASLDVPLVIDVKSGPTWSDMKELK